MGIIGIYVSESDVKNPMFSKILKYLSKENFNTHPKLMICLCESATENITVFSYLIQNHKEYRCWGLTIDERPYDLININQSLIWLSEQDSLTELNLNTNIRYKYPNISQILLNSPHLERFNIGRNFRKSKDIRAVQDNYTILSYFKSSGFLDNHILNITKRNNTLREITRKCSLTLMMIRKFCFSLFSPLDKNVVKIIAKFLYEQRYEPNHLKTLSISTSWETKFEDKKSLEEVESLL